MMLLLYIVLAQRTYTNVAPQDHHATYQVIRIEEKGPAAPRLPLPDSELAGLRANQYVALPPEWAMGPTVTVYDPGPNWPLPKQVIPQHYQYEGQWNTPMILYSPLYGIGVRPPLRSPATHRGGRR